MLHWLKLRFLTVVALFLANIGYAQTTPASDLSINENDAIGITIGTHLGYFKDTNYSPLNYRESGLLTSIFYQHQSRNSNRIFTTRADYTSGNLKSDAGSHFTTARYEGNIEASLLFRLKPEDQKRLRFFVGPHLNFFVYYMQWDGQERDAWNYLMMQGLNIKGLVTFQATERKHFSSSISIPLIGNLVRPPYNGLDQFIVEHQENVFALAFHGKPASVGDYFAVDWRTNYQYSLSARVSLQAEYMFRFQKVAGSSTLAHFQNQFSGGLMLKF